MAAVTIGDRMKSLLPHVYPESGPVSLLSELHARGKRGCHQGINEYMRDEFLQISDDSQRTNQFEYCQFEELYSLKLWQKLGKFAVCNVHSAIEIAVFFSFVFILANFGIVLSSLFYFIFSILLNFPF